MSSGYFPKLPTPIRNMDDQEVQRAFDTYRSALVPLFTNPMLSGVFVSALLTVGVTNLVRHNLSTSFTGWWIVDATIQSEVWRDSLSAADKAVYLPLVTSATVTVALWVF